MSSTSQHTPGPWIVFTANNFTTIQGAVEDHPIRPGRATVASIGWTKAPSALSNWQSNARLIAAAPELLTALADCLAFWDAPPTGFDCPTSRRKKLEAIQRNARAAIAKATGGNAS